VAADDFYSMLMCATARRLFHGCENEWVRALLAILIAAGIGCLTVETGSTGAASPIAHQAPARLGDLLTYDYDNVRSGDDPVAGRITGLRASPAWNDSLDGPVFAEPLIYDGVTYIATENDSLYALGARNGTVLWKLHVGTAVNLNVVHETPGIGGSCGDIDPLGITGTPVIDPGTNELYLAAEVELPGHSTWTGVRHELIAVSLSSHRILWQRDIDPPGGNNPGDFYIPAEQQRPALTLDQGNVYVAFGGLAGDCGQYHGFLVGVTESGTGPLLVYQTPSAREAAIWETNGAVVGADGRLYVATGNGASNNPADFDEGNSVIELTPSLRRVGAWAPSNWVQLNDDDWDLGSAGPIQVPGSDYLFIAGKPTNTGAYGYLLNEHHLKGIGSPAYSALVCSSGGVFGADAVDVLGAGATKHTIIYAPCGGGTAALEISVSPPSFHLLWQESADGPPIVAGGLVWALSWQGGGVYGMNPLTGAVVVERPTASLDHFATPGVGDSVLIVPTEGGAEAFRTIG
jgi:polyvinyl alcohol dehydrogenase (cytochrome)